ncbi:MAG: hypothetical protein ACYSU0_03540 [Planctomycetota bacterium]|jgi:hypothetical protein
MARKTKKPKKAKKKAGKAGKPRKSRKPKGVAKAKKATKARPPSTARRTPPTSEPVATVEINRAPVLTLWGAVVAERLGYDRDAALTLGKAMAGLNAQSKGRRLGIFGEPKPPERGGPPKKVGLGEEFWIEICGRPVPGKNTPDGVRAVIRDKPIDPSSVLKYLEGKFGESLGDARAAMADLASSYGPDQLQYVAYSLYERFRPQIEPGRRGWGQKGTLDLALVRSLAGRG